MLLFVVPSLSILSLLLLKKSKEEILSKVALLWSLMQLLVFSLFLVNYRNSWGFQYSYLLIWVKKKGFFSSWGSTLFMFDGISLFFIGLSILLVPICILISWRAIDKLKKEFFISLFSVLIFLMGVFTIMDLLGFYILFETILIPMFLIIGIWGSREEKVKAAYYFFFYTLIGSLLMLVSIFKIYSLTGTTNYHVLLNFEIPRNLQFWLFIGFFASLAVKIPMFPFHIWLPQAHVEAPISGSVLLAGILLKLGGYGFIRFSFPLFPIASEYFSPMVIMLSIIAVVYGAFTTCRQTDIKRLIAYSSVSHMGLVTLSVFVHSIEGVIASIIMMLAHGLVSSGLFMSSAFIYTRFHTRAIKYFKGLTIFMPLLSLVTFLLLLGNISFPGTLNFLAEFSSLLVATRYSLTSGVLVCFGIFLGTVYSLYMFNRIYFGGTSQFLINVRDINSFEFSSLLPLVILTIFLGILPGFIIEPLLMSSLVNISL